MLALGRFLVIGFVVLSVIYVCLLLYSRARARARLEAEWAEQGEAGDRDMFIAQGMKDYEGSLQRKLILGVYVVPVVLVAVMIYVTNFA